MRVPVLGQICGAESLVGGTASDTDGMHVQGARRSNQPKVTIRQRAFPTLIALMASWTSSLFRYAQARHAAQGS